MAHVDPGAYMIQSKTALCDTIRSGVYTVKSVIRSESMSMFASIGRHANAQRARK